MIEPKVHRQITSERPWGTDLTCECGEFAVTFQGGEWRRSEIDAKFREHLSEQEANVNPSAANIQQCTLDLTHIGGTKFPTGEPHHWVWMKSPHSIFIGVCSICHIPNFENLRVTVEEVWTEAYRAGVHDERTVPADQRYGPNEDNPYGVFHVNPYRPFPGDQTDA